MKKYFSFLFALLVAFSLFFVSCDKSEPDLDPTLCKINVTGTEGGKVKISKYLETSEIVLIGNEIEVVAIPDEGYVFTGWYVGNSTEPVSTDAVFTFVATRSTTLTARFIKQTYLTLLSSGNGSVSFKGSYGSSVAILPGTEVTVVATPDKDCDFVGWFIGDAKTAVGTDAEYTFVVEKDITLTAKFVIRLINGYEWVNLGLPSGLKWATCNVGATSPEDYGGYYAWGETEEKSNYDWSTYKWNNGSYDTMTKYCTNSDYGTVDNKTVLDPKDDVAHVKWGGTWRMPTFEEQKELLNNCTWQWTTQNGVTGYKVTGPNGNSIFLPAAGYRYGTGDYDRGNYGIYWSGSLGGDSSYLAYNLYIHSSYRDWYVDHRSYGLSVRPVSK